VQRNYSHYSCIESPVNVGDEQRGLLYMNTTTLALVLLQVHGWSHKQAHDRTSLAK
jgi:hypothetical protein